MHGALLTDGAPSDGEGSGQNGNGPKMATGGGGDMVWAVWWDLVLRFASLRFASLRSRVSCSSCGAAVAQLWG